MEYEKLYKESLERAKKLQQTCDSTAVVGWCEYIFPELKESEDEKMMHQLHSWMKEFGGAEEYTEKVYTWLKSLLEKQGEQKKSYDVCDSSMMDNKKSPYGDKRDFGYFEEKPANKVEPKFYEGEWITNGDYTWKIVEVKPLDYILQSQEGNIVDDTISHVDEQFHSFTIKDAKDGDVLACPLPKGCESGEQIFIFKGINSRDYVDNCIEYYCRICEGVFYENENGYMGTTSSPIYPATKEQRDTLFAKMQEAGYEWDAEKKELKKISQRMVSAEAKEALYDKPAWSEEDEEILRTIISDGLRGAEFDMLQINWLKSLKQRIGWKPSDEQMIALSEASGIVGMLTPRGMHLQSLYNDLKKLK